MSRAGGGGRAAARGVLGVGRERGAGSFDAERPQTKFRRRGRATKGVKYEIGEVITSFRNPGSYQRGRRDGPARPADG